MKEVIYITGHKNPDTDSICAAIAYAEFKNKTQSITAIPVRLGELNLETKFVLDFFKLEAPLLIDTVKVQVSDLDIDKIAPISQDISLKMAWNLMKRNNVKTMPVTNEHNNLIGIVSMSNLISSFMDIWDNAILAKSHTPLENITATLSAKIIYFEESKPYFEGKIVITSISSSSISDGISNEDIAICSDSTEVQQKVIEKGVSLLIITDNNKVEENIIELAKNRQCSIIVTPHDSFTAARLITQSVPVKYVMTRDNLISFSTEDFVEEIKDAMLESRYRSYPVIGKDDIVVGSISRYHLISKNKKKVILLDHNERSQAVDGLEEAEVLEIIDHHRIADVQTGNPIYFRNEPVGSTSTIVASLFFENGIRPSKGVAGILCAAIISDTLLLKSPTSTIVDQIMLKRLCAIADIDADKFAKEMFKAGTSLRDKNPEEIFHQDFKAFTINNLKVGVSQIGTLDMESVESMKKSILDLMNRKVKENGFFVLIFMITDILKGGSELMIAGEEKEILSRAFNVQFENDSVYLPGVVSRKKQVIPPISSVIANMKKD